VRLLFLAASFFNFFRRGSPCAGRCAAAACQRT
jgi:hypothetical protein